MGTDAPEVTDAAAFIAYAKAHPDQAAVLWSKYQCEKSLYRFALEAWHVLHPSMPMLLNWHLPVIFAYIQGFYDGRIKRLAITIPPGCMKSLAFSVFGAAWMWTQTPGKSLITLSNALDLSTRDAMKHRDIIQSDWFQARWPHIQMIPDRNGKELFANQQLGFRQALGISGNVTGRRSDFILIDDALDASKSIAEADNARVNTVYDQTISSRLNSPVDGGIGIICQRLREDDLVGHVMDSKEPWVLCRIPMEYERGTVTYDPISDLGDSPENRKLIDPRTEENELMFPTLYPRDKVDIRKAQLGEFATASQLQQNPVPRDGGILKPKYFQCWPKDDALPSFSKTIISMDTAYSSSDHKNAAYSTLLVFSVATHPDRNLPIIIMRRAWHGRVEFPELKRVTKEWVEAFEPELLLVEAKASGLALVPTMRDLLVNTETRVKGFDPGTTDKIGRANDSTPYLEAKLIFHLDEEWAYKTIKYLGSFPNGAAPSADYADAFNQCILYCKDKKILRIGSEIRKPYVVVPRSHRSEEWQEDNPERGGAYG